MIRQKFKPRKFIIGKSPENSLEGQQKQAYYKNIEKAMVVTLILFIFGFQVLTHFDVDKHFVKKRNITLDLLDILNVTPEIEEPPKMKMEEVVEVQPEPEPEKEALSEEQMKVMEEIEEILNEPDEPSLSLVSNENPAYLLSDSPIGHVAGTELKVRDRKGSEDGRIALRKGRVYGDDNAGGLEIGKTKTSTKKLISDNSGLDISAGTGRSERRSSEATRTKKDKLGITNKNVRILSFASSMIGTEDYKIWNKINSELDRLNKGRYGSVPDEIKRNGRGFTITFDFADGNKQEINWRNDGNVWIKVVGKSNKTTVQELRRALNGLLGLLLRN